jgi:guanosine-3',5'-bis(diphosphate) 3'-pyrophosphohydrolase
MSKSSHPANAEVSGLAGLGASERLLLSDLFAIVSEHATDSSVEIDRERVQDAFVFACEYHAAQRRKSGEDSIVHRVGVACICASMRVDTETLCAVVLQDTVEDTSASIEEVRARFGEEIAAIVDGVTKLKGIIFRSHDEAQANNYRKMMVAMATDVRVILIKLADRLYDMRTIEAMPKQKQMEKARETLDIYAPLAHRLGIHAIKGELDDLAFATLHPSKCQEIKALVGEGLAEREQHASRAAEYLQSELQDVGIEAKIAGRAKHLYAIYSDLTVKKHEFNEMTDLLSVQVLVSSVKDCYGAVGVIHSLWKPLPGRFKDFIAMPKFNMYQSLHTTVIGPEGRPLEIQICTYEMHEMAEFGVAGWDYSHLGEQVDGPGGSEDTRLKWLRSMLDWQKDISDPQEFMETLRTDLFEEEVYVFTPKGEVKSLAVGATPLDFAYEVHTEVGHGCVGARVNGKIVRLDYELQSGDIVEILTAKRERGPSRDWLAIVKTTRARNKIKAWFNAESRVDTERAGRIRFEEELQSRGIDPHDKSLPIPLADALRNAGYRKADEFYSAVGSGKIQPRVVIERITRQTRSEPAGPSRPSRRRHMMLIDGGESRRTRLADCCRPIPGDPIIAYSSFRWGTTIHHRDCLSGATLAHGNLGAADWQDWDAPFSVELQVATWDRREVIADVLRVLDESGAGLCEVQFTSDQPPLLRGRCVVELSNQEQLRRLISKLRAVESVFDVFRVQPAALVSKG